jgi:hypothetical protein
MELSLETSALSFQRVRPRDRRLARARWWFEQMHVVVDRAMDWSAPVPPPPRQTALSLAGGSVAGTWAGSRRSTAERGPKSALNVFVAGRKPRTYAPVND